MTDRLRIGLISDTHGLLRNEVYAAFEGVDEVLHAGDVGDPAILDELEVIAPVRAVYGNVDGFDVREVTPERLELERAGHRIAVVHGHQWGSPRVSDLAEAFHDFAVVVYGHTHEPLIEGTDGPLIVNPGSAGHRRFGKPVTVATLKLARNRRPAARLVDLLD
ncbi:MAG: metallophosphoesterase family protein [Gemmatimonadetes bacterium]|uniref:Phosphoesterase n=1 Tax=Candidatus Kutchimonas denitrificans TaxID=3056748 RepID=A0AAE5CDE0_9BACT|nr:metallophosphoesterase family protein [Gemmatimonadota bacterium]NIR75599.1 metallophosphoesterase family protein [Candidatus Kutchimonas denitrificans]NIS01913.1 metallophosphoesterase family protein [Gemmatimonadota bacterium]NIT67694.1 metallophosphoesterase family protein [Gemmatimonadota bacterium]NIU53568.1 YfcE family phosphodiesterase [Gemmatimonadota bacterium]